MSKAGKHKFPDNYPGLTDEEGIAAMFFWEIGDGDLLGKLIAPGREPSDDFRRLVSDVLSGKVERPKTKPNKFKRDFMLAVEFGELTTGGAGKKELNEKATREEMQAHVDQGGRLKQDQAYIFLEGKHNLSANTIATIIKDMRKQLGKLS